jgi:hypothetical protein
LWLSFHSPFVVSIKKIKVEDKEMEIAGLDEEFEKYFSEDRTPENFDGEEVIQDLGR